MGKTQLIEETIRNHQGYLSADGALLVNTGKYTGRCTRERFLVARLDSQSRISWGPANQPIDPPFADQLFSALEKRLAGPETHTGAGFIGSLPIFVKSTSPWHIAFSENMFRHEPLDVTRELLRGSASASTAIEILHDPRARPAELGLAYPGDVLIVLDPSELRIAILGTAYAGEIKKAAFSLCNYLLPAHGILPMHAGANCSENGQNTCVLFGLSGTGKTTLSADSDRWLIGDDELIWTESGISNLEGGCYAKLIDLDPLREPEIHRAVNRFGAIQENVCFHERTRQVNFSDRGKTENTRGSYELAALGRVHRQDREAEAPHTIVFLAADAFGALPAVAKLDSWQAQYHFLSGYTAKVAGTELGVREPQAVFSACFGEPFMPRHPSVYAELLARLAGEHGSTFWLLNTGWTGGGYGKGPRFPIAVSRRILRAIQSGELLRQPAVPHPVFGFLTPLSCPDVDPRWLAMPEAAGANKLREKFLENEHKFAHTVDPRVLELGGPRPLPGERQASA